MFFVFVFVLLLALVIVSGQMCLFLVIFILVSLAVGDGNGCAAIMPQYCAPTESIITCFFYVYVYIQSCIYAPLHIFLIFVVCCGTF